MVTHDPDRLLDVLVRFHSMSRFDELDRCLFSLVAQPYRPARINLLTQRFTGEETDELNRRLAPMLSLADDLTLNIINFAEADPVDARTRLLNLGLANTDGRYIAFLDYDDVIYPEAYISLIRRMRPTDCAIAFARVVVKRRDVFEDALMVTTKEELFVGAGLVDLFRDNFCPIHSFVIDRRRVPPDQLHFSEVLSKLEDYDFLLRLTAICPSDFGFVANVAGDYYFKNDGSNTIQTSESDASKDPEDWAQAREYIAALKEKTIISDRVQRQLALPELLGGLTIGRLVSAHQRWRDQQREIAK